MNTVIGGREVSLEQRVRVLHALGDPLRLSIVDLLQVQDLSPDTLSGALEVPGNLLSHHLKVLEGAGVVTRTHSQGDRRRTYVQLVPTALDGLIASAVSISAPRVVFVCTHNSARSVMADAAWRAVSEISSTSAGTHPAERINPRATSAAQRAGLKIDESSPRRIEDVLRPDDLVISVCDAVNEDVGPLMNRRIHWSIPDPSASNTDRAFDGTLAQIEERVRHLAPHVTNSRTATHRRTS